MRLLKKGLCLVIIFLFMIMTACNKQNKNEGKNALFLRADLITEPIQNELLEIALFEKELKIKNEFNPYDYNDLKVEAIFTSPSNKVSKVYAFWYQDYSIVFNTMANISPSGIHGVASTNQDEPQGLELVNPVGDEHYRIRFTPEEVGKYHLEIKTYKQGKLYSTEKELDFEVSKGEKKTSVIEVDPTTNRTFRYRDSKQTFIPIGQNTAWYTSSTRKTIDYSVWFSKMNENKMNTTRIWMASWGFAIHFGKAYNDFSDRFAQAARLDKVIEYANEYNIYFMLTLINHGQFSYTTNPEWDSNPWNKANGGILDKPHEFFTDENARAEYKNELLYIISRYGYSKNILCYELFNEVDWVDGYTLFSSYIKSWHKEMASFIKEYDYLNHMVSTSYKGTDGNAYSLDEIDFVSPHDYGYSSKKMQQGILDTQVKLSEKYNKPVLFGEIGLNGQNGNDTYSQDKTGITLHLGAWCGMMASGAGGAFPWWWDSYIHPYNLYYRFKGAAVFSSLMDLTGSDYTLIQNTNYSVSNTNLMLMGYRFNNRMYGYLIDSAWTFRNTSLINKTATIEIPFSNGVYTLSFYDPKDGIIIKTEKLTVVNNTLRFDTTSFTTDLAFIIN